MTERRGGARRSEAARLAILEATARQFQERGFAHLSVEAIAAAAGVGKQTIYRWWGSKSDLIAEAMLEGMLLPAQFAPGTEGTLRDDLRVWLTTVLAFADDPANAEVLRSLLAAATENAAIGDRLRAVLGADAQIARRIEQGMRAGEVAAGVSVGAVSQLLVGTIIIRLLARAETRDGDVDGILDVLLPPTD